MLALFFIASCCFYRLSDATRNDRGRCRCLATQSCWPSSSDWNSLNSSVNGALISVKPAATPCHDPAYDQAACDLVNQKWSDPWWRADQPGALQSPHFEFIGDSDHCLASTPRSSNCSQGSLPLFSVRVSSSSQIQAAVVFASKFNLRLVIKNTGHEFTSRSTAPNSLSIWTHWLKDITFMEKFTPVGAPWWRRWWSSGQPAVKVGAGVQWEELYKAAFERRRTVVGAQCTSVGAAGGYALGGGHSQLSPTFGLAADNVLEFEVVTADGKLLVANAYQNQELFWALKGGGGGTFGVVVSLAYATFPALQNLVFASYTFSTNISSTYRSFLSYFLALNPLLSDMGWGGSFLLTSTSINVQYLLPNKNSRFAEWTFRSLLTGANRLQVSVSSNSGMQTFNSYYEWHLAVQCFGGKCGFPSGSSIAETSRLVPRRVVQYQSEKLSDALIKFVDAKVYPRIAGYLVGGGKVSLPQWSAVNPAWRQALLHVLVVGIVPEQAGAQARQGTMVQLSNTNQLLRDLTKGSGSYLNEADYFEPSWQQSFFGQNYPALKRIKDKVDPKGLLICRHCVGSEEWSEDMNCRL